MIRNIIVKFNLQHDKEESNIIIENIDKGVVFKGTNLWILIFAIFICSLGLNVNSTAVIIGAMLISPLMGPIMGLGLSVGINDLSLLRKSFYNYSVAAGAALATSTLFFLISPLNDAHSEILARTAPNIYDVLIALFGGLAGIVATASRQKGNVIPGVAIATALMPPLCTAGYGLAAMKFEFFFGAFYLFIINTVFIALATFITVRFLNFPFKHLPDNKADSRAKRIIWSIVIVTIVPSLYFGYDIVQQDKFTKKAERFIAVTANFPNDYLLSKKVDAKNKTISLVYGGAQIPDSAITILKAKLAAFELQDALLEVHQGFAYLANTAKIASKNDEAMRLNVIIKAKEAELQGLHNQVDSIQNFKLMCKQVFDEMKAQYADFNDAIFTPGELLKTDSVSAPMLVSILNFKRKKTMKEKNTIENWLKVRFRRKDVKTIFL
ncbi:MAG: DUF389 domain-containing protein [Bacteroidota bacterium]